ncbi:hypothetical protein [Brasilonema sp. UFV-L1]|uniref:dual OB domain-containing protein n=1 Tax=Brasilonema sp. UFV-L1 TaxID=2234130 RepID=UPI00145CB4B1|nr:hypothetical protein [Brasilonema sp. UFV-L1]NMG08187.1 hypothetical protein [Brasilonema sp. UFV-L1]
MAKIICLANSQKHNERCIAGIEISTGKWIRPVSYLDDGRIPRNVRLVNGEEPKLLDILEIPLAETSPGYECENRLISPGKWKCIGKASVNDLVKYCEDEMIYSQWLNSVPFSFLQELPSEDRRTLQLIKTSILKISKYEDTGKWEASVPIANGQIMKAKITDLAVIDKLNKGVNLSHDCLMTISFAQPWRRSPSEKFACWKLVAAIVELSEIDLILFEMKRLGWSIGDGRSYLQKTYKKQTRQELNASEIKEFLNYLKSLSQL